MRSQADYIGEPVSQLEHSLQTAALAVLSGADEPLVLAALLHDIGHWCEPGAIECSAGLKISCSTNPCLIVLPVAPRP
ncbi:MAG: HD domain-containing protein [Pseudomonadales bacterium]|nr:HD domain-containing protein [Pseudomonadales bacterium]